MLIRRAVPADAEAIVEVANAGWRWAYSQIIRAEDLATLESPERTARIGASLAKDHVTFVAEIEGRVVGFASIDEPCRLPGADFEIGGLYVHPSAARQGIGRALTAEAVRYGLAQARTKLAIHTLRDNRVGRSFYEGLGGVPAQDGQWIFRGVEYPTVWYLFEDLADLVARIGL